MGEHRSRTERVEIAGDQLAAKIKELYKDASARRVIIRDSRGKQLLAIPLTYGVAGSAFLVLTAPMLATVAGIGAALARVQLEIERVDPPAGPTT